MGDAPSGQGRGDGINRWKWRVAARKSVKERERWCYLLEREREEVREDVESDGTKGSAVLDGNQVC